MPSPSLERNPEIDAWIRLENDGRVLIRTGKVELGQGITSALALIAAEELDVDPDRIRMAPVDTASSPDEGRTTGSKSIEQSGSAIRQVAAEARQILLDQAATHLATSIDRLTVSDGRVHDLQAGSSVTFWELPARAGFERRVSGLIDPKTPEQISLTGPNQAPPGLRAIVAGTPYFLHDLELDGMLHARVVRPPHYHARLASLDDKAARSMSGVVDVVRDGSFLGVVAAGEYQAVAAAERLAGSATWSQDRDLDDTDVFTRLVDNPRQSVEIVEGRGLPGPPSPVQVPPDVTSTLQATYERPYHMHASLGPSVALAQWSDGLLTVWTHCQGVYPLRAALMTVFDLPATGVRVIHVPGAGSYGHNGADDAALDAALLSRAVSPRPVRLMWSRQDEHSWEPYGSAMVLSLRAELAADGMVVGWHHDTYSDTHSTRPGPEQARSALLAARHIEPPSEEQPATPNLNYHGGAHRNADPIYAFPYRRIIKHLVGDLPLRVSATRSLGGYANVFAIESFMDELAHLAGSDPLEYRLRHLEDPRGRAVLTAVAEKVGWDRIDTTDGEGRGLAFARYENSKCYVAVFVRLRVDDYGVTRLDHAVVAADAGRVIDPDGLRNQLEGGFLQSASWSLKEEVRFSESGITSRDWETYPILTFAEVPEIETVLLDQPGEPSLGAGEGAQGPTAAAIANAIFDATGLRIRRIPFTPQRIYEAAGAADPQRSE